MRTNFSSSWATGYAHFRAGGQTRVAATLVADSPCHQPSVTKRSTLRWTTHREKVSKGLRLEIRRNRHADAKTKSVTSRCGQEARAHEDKDEYTLAEGALHQGDASRGKPLQARNVTCSLRLVLNTLRQSTCCLQIGHTCAEVQLSCLRTSAARPPRHARPRSQRATIHSALHVTAHGFAQACQKLDGVCIRRF